MFLLSKVLCSTNPVSVNDNFDDNFKFFSLCSILELRITIKRNKA